MNTIYLDPASWDLALDSSGNIALAEEPYSLAQDAASAIKTFQGEVYYNTSLGVPYFQEILGKFPPTTLIKAQFIKAALTVPDVVSAQVFIASITARRISGQVSVTNSAGLTSVAGF